MNARQFGNRQSSRLHGGIALLGLGALAALLAVLAWVPRVHAASTPTISAGFRFTCLIESDGALSC